MLDERYIVKKSTPLILAEWANLGLHELKILEVYLSRINIKKESTCVRFTKKEFAELMGYNDSRNLKTKTFDERLSHFLSQQVKIDLEDGSGYHRFNLFSDAKCYFDQNEKMAIVELDCNPKLTSAFISLADGENNGYHYISYRVEKTKNMKCEYSVKLYSLLLLYAWGNFKWVVDLDELKTKLGAVEESYDNFKYFNYYVLKKAQKEINEMTDIKFEYEKITSGRITKKIIFYIQKKKGEIFEPCIPLPCENEGDIPAMADIESTPYQAFCAQVNKEAFNNTFSQEEAEYFVHLGKQVADARVEKKGAEEDKQTNVRIDYYREKYLQMMAGNPRSKKGLLEHLFKVDAAEMIGFEYAGKDDLGSSTWKPKTTNTKFNNFKGRTYDWNELEKQLLNINRKQPEINPEQV